MEHLKKRAWICVDTDVMAGEINPGDDLLIDPDAELKSLSVVLVRIRDQGLLLRRYGAKEGTTVHFTADNPRYRTIEAEEGDYHILGVATRHRPAEREI